MRSTVVPAQITTVEDRIAGSLTFPQIILLVSSLIFGAAIYAILMPKLHYANYKMAIIVLQFAFFGSLSLRFNGKILADWLIVFLRYRARPRRYIFTKNDLTHRNVIFETEVKTNTAIEEKEKTEVKEVNKLSMLEQIKFDRIFKDEDLSISFKLAKKGGFDVTVNREI
jgi:hypothetical protein